MGAHTTQGLAVLIFLVAFTCLSGAFFADGNLLLVLIFLLGAAISVALFLKAKPMEQAEK